MALGSTQFLAEMSKGGKGGRCVRLQHYHHPVPLSWNLGNLTSWNHLGHSRPVTGLLLLCQVSTLCPPVAQSVVKRGHHVIIILRVARCLIDSTGSYLRTAVERSNFPWTKSPLDIKMCLHICGIHCVCEVSDPYIIELLLNSANMW